ncbi:MAG: MBL fold metallo-hydrolase, partial [Lachnoclostridium sp.]|nr:MBL fold metallo-hydrolase [Lachnoclostridium sp.]
MKLFFSGAAHEVTGSCHCMEVGEDKFCIDCGMEQGEDIFVKQELPVSPANLDFILVTHAHIDHTGLLPLMYAKGFRGSIYATKATVDLCGIMLRDSAHIQMFEAEWRNRKALRSGDEPYSPLYTMEDAFGAIRLLVPCNYNEKIVISDNVTIRFTDIGHLLGSSSIEVFAREGDIRRTVV